MFLIQAKHPLAPIGGSPLLLLLLLLLLFLSAQVGCTQAQSHTVQAKIGFLPQGFSNLIFSSLLPLFLFQCTMSSEALAVLKHFTVHCFVGKTWVLWLWVIKGFSFPLHCFSRGNVMGVTVTNEPCWESPGHGQLSARAVTPSFLATSWS